MIKSGWIKYFVDGSSCVGSDELISKGKASWIHSRNHGIVKVALFHDSMIVSINGLYGNWWQSDTFEAIYGNPQSKLISRRIMRQIGDNDQFMYVDQLNKEKHLEIEIHKNNREIITSQNQVRNRFCLKEYRGKWLVAEMNVLENITGYYFLDRR